MNRIFLILAGVLVSASAFAADLPSKKAPPAPAPLPMMAAPQYVAPAADGGLKIAIFGGLFLEGGGNASSTKIDPIFAAMCGGCGGGVGPQIGTNTTKISSPSSRFGALAGVDIGLTDSPFFARLDGKLANRGGGIAAGVGYDFGGWRLVASATWDSLGSYKVTSTDIIFPGPMQIVSTATAKAKASGAGVRFLAEVDAVQLDNGLALTPQVYAGWRDVNVTSTTLSPKKSNGEGYVGAGLVVRWQK